MSGAGSRYTRGPMRSQQARFGTARRVGLPVVQALAATGAALPAGGWFPDQRLTIEEAIDAATRAPAWAAFEEDRKGVLRPGMLADVAVLDTNLVEVGHANPAALLKAQVHYTIAGGRVVFERRTGENRPSGGR